MSNRDLKEEMREINLITVNEEKCIKCEICIKECPTYVLKMGEKGPEEIVESSCIACGHCVAVYPNDAIDNNKTPFSQQVDSKAFHKLDSEEAEHFLRARRS